MKAYKNLYPELYRLTTLHQAAQEANLSLSDGPMLQKLLMEKLFGEIWANPVWQQIALHSLCLILRPLAPVQPPDRLEQQQTSYSHYLRGQFEQLLSAVDHTILRSIFHKRIACPDTLAFIDYTLQVGLSDLTEPYRMVYFPDDDLLVATRDRGLPREAITTPLWVDFYLAPCDLFVTQELHQIGYIRRFDQLWMFADNADLLTAQFEALGDFVTVLRLTIKISDPS